MVTKKVNLGRRGPEDFFFVWAGEVCLVALLETEAGARACLKRFAGLTNDPRRIGKQMATLFTDRLAGAGGKLKKNEQSGIAAWPGVQLIAVKQAVIAACEQRIAGVPIQASMSARLGYPRGVSITWSGDSHLGVEFVGPALF